jgi:hypothetical protein
VPIVELKPMRNEHAECEWHYRPDREASLHRAIRAEIGQTLGTHFKPIRDIPPEFAALLSRLDEREPVRRS